MNFLALIVALIAPSLVAQASSDPIMADGTLPGAPVASCAPPPHEIRLTAGSGPIPYQFACSHNRPEGVCAIGHLESNLLVSLGPQINGWSCVSGGDSTTGWIPSNRLAPVPDTPHIPNSAWLGWWRNAPNRPGIKGDRLLIQPSKLPGQLHVSGRAYWYGIADNVHFGELKADAVPIGPYLHLVDGDEDSPCIVDLKYNPATHTFAAFDNSNCGGMNVRFNRTWTRFTPKSTPERHYSNPCSQILFRRLGRIK